jgi:hypothetical protein
VAGLLWQALRSVYTQVFGDPSGGGGGGLLLEIFLNTTLSSSNPLPPPPPQPKPGAKEGSYFFKVENKRNIRTQVSLRAMMISRNRSTWFEPHLLRVGARWGGPSPRCSHPIQRRAVEVGGPTPWGGDRVWGNSEKASIDVDLYMYKPTCAFYPILSMIYDCIRPSGFYHDHNLDLLRQNFILDFVPQTQCTLICAVL